MYMYSNLLELQVYVVAKACSGVYFGPLLQLYYLSEIVPVSDCLVDALIDLPQGYGPLLWPGQHGPAKSFCTTTHIIHSPLANFVTCSLLILDLAHMEL
jgi:hypothetical protein